MNAVLKVYPDFPHYTFRAAAVEHNQTSIQLQTSPRSSPTTPLYPWNGTGSSSQGSHGSRPSGTKQNPGSWFYTKFSANAVTSQDYSSAVRKIVPSLTACCASCIKTTFICEVQLLRSVPWAIYRTKFAPPTSTIEALEANSTTFSTLGLIAHRNCTSSLTSVAFPCQVQGRTPPTLRLVTLVLRLNLFLHLFMYQLPTNPEASNNTTSPTPSKDFDLACQNSPSGISSVKVARDSQ
ncbi:hypothetical protein M378DRAFT_25635 [Amanita muscaria Koide BX008]|uniref:Uncharacterized protein n=1 Tax=Amanita muscaria (strain Koide BX008) TaxID=946122 RepID=A0A0C2WZK8_AMAMK|nr:hypothetical protein M378DRAFT_25635 [Amanita muscaria Koide BX008]